MSASLAESYSLCREIARNAGTNFYYSFLVMPRAKRDAMCALYAFMRHSDDIADGAVAPALAGVAASVSDAAGPLEPPGTAATTPVLQALRQWRRTVDAALSGLGILP